MVIMYHRSWRQGGFGANIWRFGILVQFGGRKGRPWACVTFGGIAVGVSHFVLVGAGRYGNCSDKHNFN